MGRVSSDTPLRVQTPSRSRLQKARLLLLAIYFGFMIWHWQRYGLPLERLQVFAWMLGAVLILRLGYSFRELGILLFDWLPLVVLLAIYDLTRGLADTTGMPIQRESVIAIEKALFGSPVPPVRWQARFLQPDNVVHWWEVATSLTYFSHFIASFAVLAALWVKSRTDFLAFRRRFLLLTAVGLTGYILLPTVPPWMASDAELIGPIQRVGLRGFRVFHWETADIFVSYGARFSNRVAAMPSLHGGWSMLIAIFVCRYVPNWAKPFLFLYPALMLFTLVVGGEHYILDVIAGFACAIAVSAGAGWWERRQRLGEPVSTPTQDMRLQPLTAGTSVDNS